MAKKNYMYGNSKCKIHWENPGFKEILNCEPLGVVCDQAAAKIAHAAGKNYKSQRWHSNMKGGRVAAIVIPSNHQGYVDEAKNKKLSKAVSRCRI